MKEKVVIIFIALVLGLFVTTIVFYIYESTKTPPKTKEETKKRTTQNTPTPTLAVEKLFLTIDEPQNEALIDKKTIQVKGKTNPKNIIIISSNVEDTSADVDSQGSFSTDLQIDSGPDTITIRAIAPNGEETTDTRLVTFSQEEF